MREFRGAGGRPSTDAIDDARDVVQIDIQVRLGEDVGDAELHLLDAYIHSCRERHEVHRVRIECDVGANVSYGETNRVDRQLGDFQNHIAVWRQARSAGWTHPRRWDGLLSESSGGRYTQRRNGEQQESAHVHLRGKSPGAARRRMLRNGVRSTL